MGVIRFLILMQTQGPQVDRLVAALTSFLKEILSKQSSAGGEDEDDGNDEQWGHMLVSSVATLLMADRKEQAKEVSLSIIQSHPKYRQQLVLAYAEDGKDIDAEDTVGVLFAALVPQLTHLEPELTAAILANFTAHVEREIDNALEYDFRFTRDMMKINDTEEEGLLFEIPDKQNVEADGKEALLKGWIAREMAIIN